MHAVEEPVVAVQCEAPVAPPVLVPLAHTVHDADPVPPAKVPTAHGAHEAAPVDDAYVPIAHALHAVALETLEKYPAAHGAHPLDVRNVPGAQVIVLIVDVAVQWVAPVAPPVLVPLGHATQLAAPTLDA